MTSFSYADAIGLSGSLLLTAAFTKAALNEAFREKAIFLIANALGSLLLLIPAIVHESYAAFSICAFWIISSIISLKSKERCLDKKWLIGSNIIFALAITCVIATSNPNALSLMGFAAVEIFVLSYSAFIAHMISRRTYLVFTLLGNAIFIPSLYFDNNIASLVLQSYCIVMSAIGLCSTEHEGEALEKSSQHQTKNQQGLE